MRHLWFLIYLVFYFSSCIVHAQGKNLKTKKIKMPLKGICAHRGAMNTHPENTLSAFKEAIRLGAQMIEFDVQLSKNNKLVIIHDSTVDRTTNGSGLVNNLKFSKLKRLDAGSWKSKEFVGEKIPTLKEVLQIMPQNIWLNIHLKGSKKLGRKTAKLILAKGRAHQAIIACEEDAALGVRTINKDLIMCNMERLNSRSAYIDETIQKKYAFIQLKKSRDDGFLTSDIQKIKSQNIRINYVQADTTDEVSTLIEYGVDFILTNHLAEMLDAFSKLK